MQSNYLIVDRRILPDYYEKVVQARDMLREGRVKEVSEAVKLVGISRSTYYKYINHKESKREQENKYIRSCILELYAKSNKRLGADKMKTCLKRDYLINISVGRVYRLMKPMNLPKMSTVKPFVHK